MGNKVNTVQQRIDQAWKQYVKEEREKRYPNVMLLGDSGAGKSSLVNRVLKTSDAKVSDVETGTEGYCNFYDGHKYGRKINLIDTAGYELGQADDYIENIKAAIKKQYDNSPVHILWYCLSIVNERIEDIDLQLLEELQKIQEIHGRICIVFTKCEHDDEKASREKSIINVLRNHGLGEIKTFETSENPDYPMQLVELVNWTADQFEDNDLRESFIGSQMVDLARKQKEAERIIQSHSVATAAFGAFEILANIEKKGDLAQYQMGMVTKIFNVYGVDTLAGLTKKFNKTTSIVDFGSRLGELVIKAIPKTEKFQKHIQTITVSGLTAVVGLAASKLSYYYVEQHIKGNDIRFEEFFSDEASAGIIATFIDSAFANVGKRRKPKNSSGK